MKSRVMPKMTSAVLTVVAVACAVGASVALGSTSSTTARAPTTLNPGDQFAVAGVRIGCVVTSSGGLTFVQCQKYKGEPDNYVKKAVPGSYGIVDSPANAVIVQQTSAGLATAVSKKQPALSGPTFKPAARSQPTRFTLKVGNRALIAGTHIMCSIVKGPTVSCANVDARLNYVVNSWAASIRATQTSLAKIKNTKGDTSTTVTRKNAS